MRSELKTKLVATLLFLAVTQARATEFEKLGSAVGKALGTTKAQKATANVGGKPVEVFYAKGPNGKAAKFAVVQKATYQPNCTHTWVIGLGADARVSEVRVVEMACPHAFPTKEESFLGQFRGKGPADAATLKEKVQTVAKATGSSEFATDAVMISIQAVSSLRKTL